MIFVGEIRDSETVDIVIRSALTGHLVFSTPHTNDSISSVGRMIDMGAEPYLVASVLEGILAQRLGRRICDECSERVSMDEDTGDARPAGSIRRPDVGRRGARSATTRDSGADSASTN